MNVFSYFWIRNWSHIATHLVGLVVPLIVGGDLFEKSLWIRHFKSYNDEILEDCFSSKYTSIDGVRFLIKRLYIQDGAITSFPA